MSVWCVNGLRCLKSLMRFIGSRLFTNAAWYSKTKFCLCTFLWQQKTKFVVLFWYVYVRRKKWAQKTKKHLWAGLSGSKTSLATRCSKTPQGITACRIKAGHGMKGGWGFRTEKPGAEGRRVGGWGVRWEGAGAGSTGKYGKNDLVPPFWSPIKVSRADPTGGNDVWNHKRV